jgi:thioredoxin 1
MFEDTDVTFLFVVAQYSHNDTITLEIHIMKTDTNSFDLDVQQSELPVLVDFYATWCGPCQMLSPVLEEIAKKYEGQAKVIKVDIEESPELAGRFGITAVPTLMVFHDGKPVQKALGFQSPRQIAAMLDKVTVTAAA